VYQKTEFKSYETKMIKLKEWIEKFTALEKSSFFSQYLIEQFQQEYTGHTGWNY
jgi:hypothetical protein